MGWLFQNTPLRHETPADYITRQFTHENAARRLTVLATATVGQVIYAAVHEERKDTGRACTFAAVILFKNNRRDGFGYKDMTEHMGPCECDCPDRIMRLLSPIEDLPNPSYVADWRARVATRKAERQRARVAAKHVAVGDIVRLAKPVTFCPGGHQADAFRLIELRQRTRIFEPLDRPGIRCRLSRASGQRDLGKFSGDLIARKPSDNASSPHTIPPGDPFHDLRRSLRHHR